MGWHTKATGAYYRTSTEAFENAQCVYAILYSMGWTLEAACGVLGNIESESGYNPWRWQSDIILPAGDPRINYQNAHAYGLCQWDPAGKYINNGSGYAGYGPNYSDQSGWINDGSAQLAYLDENADYYPTASYPLSFSEYKAATISDYSIDYLTRAWFYNFERGTWDENRVAAASYWYSVFTGQPVPPVPPPGPTRNIPIWLLFKIKEANS